MPGISYRIALDSKEAQDAFSALERSGVETARSLERAFSSLSAASGFRGLATVVTAATAAVGGLVTAMFALAKSSSDTVDELGELAAQTGSTVEEISLLRGALSQFEADTNKLQAAFNRMGNVIQQQFAAAQKSSREFANRSRADMLAVEAATLGLVEARQRLEALQTGEKTDEIDQEELALQRAILQVEQARQAQNAALARQRENELNSVARLKQFVDAIAAGASTAGIQVNATVDNLIRGLVASVGPGVQALEGIGTELGQIGQQAPALRPVILRLADVFANLKDETLKMAIATRLFGRAAATGLVEALSKGSAAIIEEENRLRSLGLVITETDKNISEGFIRSLGRLRTAVSTISTQLGLLFQPALTAALNRLADTFERNRERIIALGAAIRDRIVPAIETFTRVLIGLPQAGTDDWLVGYIENVQAFGRAVSTVITGIVLPAFRALIAIANTIASGLNSIFGTNLNAIEVLVAAWVARVLGLFRVLGGGLRFVAGLIAGIASELAVVARAGGLAAVAGVLSFMLARILLIGAAFEAFLILWRDFTATGGRVGEFERQLDALTKQFQSGQINAEEYRTKLAGLQRQFEETGRTPAGQTGGFFENLSRSVDEADGKIKQLINTTQTAGAQISQAGTQAGQGFAQAAQQIGQGARQIAAPFQTAARSVSPVVDSIREVDGQVKVLGTDLQQLQGVSFGKVLDVQALNAPAQLLQNISAAVDASVQSIQQASQPFVEMGAVVQQDITAIETLVSSVSKLSDTTAVNAQNNALLSLMPAINLAINGYTRLLEIIDAVGRRARGSFSDPISGEPLDAFAGGGFTGHGPLSKIAGVVHAQEYVLDARSTKQPGVIPFLELLRRTGGDLQAVLARFRGYDLGGLVGGLARMPSFAAGGLAGGLHPVTINFAGQSIGGLLARPDTVDELRKAAVLAQTRSAGPKPSRY